jgi:hypothetical protein
MPSITEGRRKARLRGLALALTVSTGLALGTAACAKATPNPSVSVSGMATEAGAGSGSGPVTVQGGSGGTSGRSGQRSTGTGFSLAFARCMRAHGVPKFPDPGGQLGPGSGADPASQEFQAAVNGPCRPLAPPAWLSSGEVSGA